jgi:hypothetical protein
VFLVRVVPDYCSCSNSNTDKDSDYDLVHSMFLMVAVELLGTRSTVAGMPGWGRLPAQSARRRSGAPEANTTGRRGHRRASVSRAGPRARALSPRSRRRRFMKVARSSRKGCSIASCSRAIIAPRCRRCWPLHPSGNVSLGCPPRLSSQRRGPVCSPATCSSSAIRATASPVPKTARAAAQRPGRSRPWQLHRSSMAARHEAPAPLAIG